MVRVETANEAQIEAIYNESHVLWGSGLSSADYSHLWNEISRTSWARSHARFLVSLDARGCVLSSLKQYLTRVRVFDRTTRALVVGAVFTPRALRGQGHAAALVRAIMARGREEGCGVAMLFSDIGTRYYERLGFRGLEAVEHWGVLPRRPRRPSGDWVLRAMVSDDRPRMRRAYDDSNAHRPIAIVRDEAHWRFLDVRSEIYFQRVTDREVFLRTAVASRDGRFAGYVTSVEGRDEWNIREVAVPGGSPGAIADLLRLAAVDARRRGLRSLYGWLPPDVPPCLDEWKLRSGPRKQAVPMIAPLDDRLDLDSLYSDPRMFIPYQDQF